MVRYALIAALMLTACKLEEPKVNTIKEADLYQEQSQTMVDPVQHFTPEGCGPSNDTNDQLINAEYVRIYSGYDKDNKGLVIYNRIGDKSMVIVDFRDDQTSCIREVIFNVKMLQDE